MEAMVMNRKVSYRAIIRLLAVLASAVGVNIAWATWAQATGNVEVREQGEALIITGDDSDNNIIIQEGGLVTGRADTTVIGSVQGEIHDVVIRMRGGNDFVRVDAGPGTTVFRDLKIETGMGDDTIEILGVKITDETQIDTGDGNDILLIEGVRTPFGFSRSNFANKFTLHSGSGKDLFEFHNAIFRGEVDVRLGFGIDGACGFEDSEFQRPDLVRFDGGPPSGFPGDGIVNAGLEFTIVNFEDFPDDCSFLGGRDI
jgi:hypothetical protein